MHDGRMQVQTIEAPDGVRAICKDDKIEGLSWPLFGDPGARERARALVELYRPGYTLGPVHAGEERASALVVPQVLA